MIPLASAWTSASVSISDPRAMLITHECDFITHSSGAPIRWRVPFVAGAQSTKWSAWLQISPIRSTGIVPSRPLRVTARIFTSCGSSIRISSRPMPPAPMTATVEPSSVPSSRGSQRPGPRVAVEAAHARDQQPERELGDLRRVGARRRRELHARRVAHALDPRLDAGRLQLHPAHRGRQLGEVGLRAGPDDALGLLERDGPPAALLDGSNQVLRFPGADVDRGCHLSSSGAAGSIVTYLGEPRR